MQHYIVYIAAVNNLRGAHVTGTCMQHDIVYIPADVTASLVLDAHVTDTCMQHYIVRVTAADSLLCVHVTDA